MNNLKRVLSLALSGIMLVGMMAMGASAAEFTDADKIEHDDAVNVLVALSIINGQDDGSFNPEGDVTRAQMAKMIAVAMNGGSDANTGVKATATFTDIKGHWAESYIEYCADLGIISGRGDGTFDPEGKVTGYEATKMVLTALGYDAKSYELEGAKWATSTDQLARRADPVLYEDLTGVAMAVSATRDTAAQLIWNGLQNETVRPTPNQDRNNLGEVTWQYGPSGKTMLEERYNGQIWLGTYEGNDKSIDGLDEGSIQIDNAGPEKAAEASRTSTATFPSTLGIENIGEEIKVVFKDGKGGNADEPDGKDTIYGVFNTGKTKVYNVTKSQLQDSKDTKKIKFGDTKYDAVDTEITVVTDYIGTGSDMDVSDFSNTLKVQSRDQIKFVCDGKGKIEKAYITNVEAGKVASVGSSKVTISGVGSIDIADNDVYDGIAKDDVVVYTKFYKADKDEAYFTVTKAETVEGELTGYKKTTDTVGNNSTSFDNLVVDGKTYKINDKQLKDLSDDAILVPEESDIGSTVRLYLVDGFVAAAQTIDKTGGNYAVVTEVSEQAGTNGIGSNINPLQVTVLLADGTEATVTINKESTYDGETKITDTYTTVSAQQGLFAQANTTNKNAVLIEYTSISNGSIRIKNVFNANTLSITADKLWDKDSQALTFGNKTYVAAADAVLFVGVDSQTIGNTTVNDNKADDFKAYNLRGLGSIAKATMSHNEVVAVINSDGLVKAAYTMLKAKPGSSTAETLYGIVTGYVGRRNNADGDTMYRYTVAVNRDEEVEISVVTLFGTDRLANGTLITFEETTNGEYSQSEVKPIASGSSNWHAAAVKNYSESSRLLTYFASTQASNNVYVGVGKAQSYTVDKDVKIIYINSEDGEDGPDTGVIPFNDDTGYANIMFHESTSDEKVVDVIIVETSDDQIPGAPANTFPKTTP